MDDGDDLRKVFYLVSTEQATVTTGAIPSQDSKSSDKPLQPFVAPLAVSNSVVDSTISWASDRAAAGDFNEVSVAGMCLVPRVQRPAPSLHRPSSLAAFHQLFLWTAADFRDIGKEASELTAPPAAHIPFVTLREVGSLVRGTAAFRGAVMKSLEHAGSAIGVAAMLPGADAVLAPARDSRGRKLLPAIVSACNLLQTHVPLQFAHAVRVVVRAFIRHVAPVGGAVPSAAMPIAEGTNVAPQGAKSVAAPKATAAVEKDPLLPAPSPVASNKKRDARLAKTLENLRTWDELKRMEARPRRQDKRDKETFLRNRSARARDLATPSSDDDTRNDSRGRSTSARPRRLRKAFTAVGKRAASEGKPSAAVAARGASRISRKKVASRSNGKKQKPTVVAPKRALSDTRASKKGAAVPVSDKPKAADVEVVAVPMRDIVQGLHEDINNPADDNGIVMIPASGAAAVDQRPTRPLYVMTLADIGDKFSTLRILMDTSALLPHAQPQIPVADARLAALRAFLPPGAPETAAGLLNYVENRVFAVCLCIQQRSWDASVDEDTGAIVARGEKGSFYAEGTRMASVRVEAIYEDEDVDQASVVSAEI